MKKIRNIFSILVFMALACAFVYPQAAEAQNEWVKTQWYGGMSFQYKMTDIDSAASPSPYRTGWLDWSAFDGGVVNVMLRYAATNDTIANDSLWVRIEGRMGETLDGTTASADSLIQVIDTVGFLAGSATASEFIISSFLRAPYIRFSFLEISGGEFYNDNNNNANVFIGVYNPVADYIPDKKNYIEDYPIRSR